MEETSAWLVDTNDITLANSTVFEADLAGSPLVLHNPTGIWFDNRLSCEYTHLASGSVVAVVQARLSGTDLHCPCGELPLGEVRVALTADGLNRWIVP